MQVNVTREVAALEAMTVNELRAKYAQVFGEETRVGNKAWLVKRIIWRLQALAEGDLSERARRRAAELAQDADLRLSPPRQKQITSASVQKNGKASAPVNGHLPLPGTILTRWYKGQTLKVQVLRHGFEYQGQVYKCLSTRYDDGGFTGGNMERPALKRLLADVEADKIDCLVTYKIDRLSRSLLDFARIIGIFEKHHVSFVSITQQFNSATSMGRLVLNVLLSFAQFEREIISERTRDKIAATRRKGKWSGGLPILGYDVDHHILRLVVNSKEAARVRAIFDLYLEHQALLPVVQELERRGWRTKAWVTRKGRKLGGQPFVKSNLHKLLTNATYAGKLRYKTELHNGEHAAIVDPVKWQKVQELLKGNRHKGSTERNGSGAILKGLLYCRPCGCAMSPTYSSKGNKRY